MIFNQMLYRRALETQRQLDHTTLPDPSGRSHDETVSPLPTTLGCPSKAPSGPTLAPRASLGRPTAGQPVGLGRPDGRAAWKAPGTPSLCSLQLSRAILLSLSCNRLE